MLHDKIIVYDTRHDNFIRNFARNRNLQLRYSALMNAVIFHKEIKIMTLCVLIIHNSNEISSTIIAIIWQKIYQRGQNPWKSACRGKSKFNNESFCALVRSWLWDKKKEERRIRRTKYIGKRTIAKKLIVQYKAYSTKGWDKDMISNMCPLQA